MTRVRGFPPVVGTRPRVLILGSMPSVASLERGQYYAHPRNAFWRIMADLYWGGRDLPYELRLTEMTARGIALWDVLESCFRPGSLDSNIADETARTNDFNALFTRHGSIRHVFFNGRKAESVYRGRVLQVLDAGVVERGAGLVYRVLPSTSPAHASRTYEQKLAEWSAVRDVTEGEAGCENVDRVLE